MEVATLSENPLGKWALLARLWTLYEIRKPVRSSMFPETCQMVHVSLDETDSIVEARENWRASFRALFGI